MVVRDASGRTWKIERRLVRRPRWRGFRKVGDKLGASDAFAPLPGDIGGGIGEAIAVVAGVLLLISVVIFVWPLLLLALELVLVGVVAGVRLLFGRWTIVASTELNHEEWHVRGRARARSLVDEVAESLRTGRPLPAGSASRLGAPAPPEPPRGNVRVIR